MLIRLGGEVFPAFKPYNKAAIELYVSGCYRKCIGCHNNTLHDFAYGEYIDLVKLVTRLQERQHFFQAISIVGGDLLCHKAEYAYILTNTLRHQFPSKELWLFTGAAQHECPAWVWDLFDIVKMGIYDPDQLAPSGVFPVSKNQHIWVKKAHVKYYE